MQSEPNTALPLVSLALQVGHFQFSSVSQGATNIGYLFSKQEAGAGQGEANGSVSYHQESVCRLVSTVQSQSAGWCLQSRAQVGISGQTS